MTLRPLPRSRLDGLVPSLVQGHALVALVAGTGDERWAADAAWAVARAARAAGRRVALVDLAIDEPQLHRGAGVDRDAPGIVDVFEQNTELTGAAHDVGGVFFVPAGTRTAAPEFALAHPRWKKLHAGFRAEDALLLVYLPAGALASFSVVPDGVIVLAPGGFDIDSPVGRDVRAAQVDGAMLLGVVRERWTAPPQPAPPGVHFPIALPTNEPPPEPRRRWVAPTAGVLVLVAVVAAAWVLVRELPLSRATSAAPDSQVAGPVQPEPAQREPDGPAVETAPAATDTAAIAPADPPAATPAAASAPTGSDTLAWVIQLAAYSRVANALVHADDLVQAGTDAHVAPVATGAAAAVWYRVLAGGWRDRRGALAGRDTLWARGLARRGEGELLRAPFVLALRGAANMAALRRRGIPVVTDGGRPVVGVFETAEQAAYARDQLERVGVGSDLVVRRGRIP